MLIPFNNPRRKIGTREEGRSEIKESCWEKTGTPRAVTERKVERMGRDRRREGEVEVIRGKARQGELGPTCNYPV